MLRSRLISTATLAGFLLVPSIALAATGDIIDGENSTGSILDVNTSGTGSTTETTDQNMNSVQEEQEEEVQVDRDIPIATPVFELPALPSPRNESALTRAELTAYIVQNLYSDVEIDLCFWNITSPVPPEFTLVYTDVHVNSPYAKYICMAMRDGLVRGFDDGSFLPDREVSLAEATKIISRAYALAPYGMLNEGTWYWPYLESLTAKNALPVSFTSLTNKVGYAELMEILNRIDNDITWLPSSSMQELLPPRPLPIIRSAEPAETTMNSSPSNTSASSSSTAIEDDSNSSVSPSTKEHEEEEDKPWWNPF